MENNECPLCAGKKTELIPLNSGEKYEYEIDPSRGLEIKFSKI
jgi:hypothetical protein